MLVECLDILDILDAYEHATGAEARGAVMFGDEMIDEEWDLAICGPILMEVVQGCRSEQNVAQIIDYFGGLIYLPTPEDSYIQSAAMYRLLRKRGVTVRKSMDCLIATIAIQSDCELMAEDRDFDNIAKHTRLRIGNSR